jgi:hypothetical protein
LFVVVVVLRNGESRAGDVQIMNSDKLWDMTATTPLPLRIS